MKTYVNFEIKIDRGIYFKVYISLFILLIFTSLILYYYPYGDMDNEKIIYLSSLVLLLISLPFTFAFSPKGSKRNYILLALITLFGIFPLILFTEYRSNMNETFMLHLNGVIKKKYISNNHGYLSVIIETKDGNIVNREGISKNIWNNLKVGDFLVKHKYSFDILINGRKFSMIDRNVKIIPSIQRKNIKNP